MSGSGHPDRWLADRPIEAGRVAFSIAAPGCGMDPERLPTLYSPFYSVPGQPHGRFLASGLAHRVARLLVEAMGSELHLENGDDSGVRWSFDLDLPLVARAPRGFRSRGASFTMATVRRARSRPRGADTRDG